MTDSEARIVSQKLETIVLTHSPPVTPPLGEEGEGGRIFFKNMQKGTWKFSILKIRMFLAKKGVGQNINRTVLFWLFSRMKIQKKTNTLKLYSQIIISH